MATLNEHLELLTKAKHPEDVFGEKATDKSLQAAYKKLLVEVHEDKFHSKSDKEKAAKAAGLLALLLQKATEKLKQGTYGKRESLHITLTSKGGVYLVQEKLVDGDICTIYKGVLLDIPVLIKVCRTPKNNDLVKNEAKVLTHLWNSPAKDIPAMKFHIPRLLA